jgi:predicted nuclease of predicted toxin-antitoxin system
MSRPRFLADNDLNDAIVVGVRRREPAAEFARLRDLGLAARSDPEVLDFAARESWIVVSHDVNTMRQAARARLTTGLPMNGLILAHQRTPVSPIIECLLLIWAASEAEEWSGQVEFLPL